jgi:hypothetical protein
MSLSNQAFPGLGSNRANDNQETRAVTNSWQNEVKVLFYQMPPTISDQA